VEWHDVPHSVGMVIYAFIGMCTWIQPTLASVGELRTPRMYYPCICLALLTIFDCRELITTPREINSPRDQTSVASAINENPRAQSSMTLVKLPNVYFGCVSQLDCCDQRQPTKRKNVLKPLERQYTRSPSGPS